MHASPSLQVVLPGKLFFVAQSSPFELSSLWLMQVVRQGCTGCALGSELIWTVSGFTSIMANAVHQVSTTTTWIGGTAPNAALKSALLSG